jgi:hypothetical protein
MPRGKGAASCTGHDGATDFQPGKLYKTNLIYNIKNEKEKIKQKGWDGRAVPKKEGGIFVETNPSG